MRRLGLFLCSAARWLVILDGLSLNCFPVLIAIRLAIDIATVVSKQPGSTGLETDIPRIRFPAQIGRLYRVDPFLTQLLTTDFALSGSFLNPVPVCSEVFGFPGFTGSANRSPGLLIEGIDNPGSLRTVAIEIAVSPVVV